MNIRSKKNLSLAAAILGATVISAYEYAVGRVFSRHSNTEFSMSVSSRCRN